MTGGGKREAGGGKRALSSGAYSGPSRAWPDKSLHFGEKLWPDGDTTTTMLGPSSQSSGATRFRRGAPQQTQLKRAKESKEKAEKKKIYKVKQIILIKYLITKKKKSV